MEIEGEATKIQEASVVVVVLKMSCFMTMGFEMYLPLFFLHFIKMIHSQQKVSHCDHVAFTVGYFEKN